MDKSPFALHGFARVFFTVDDGGMILLHGFIKKSQKTPANELKTATECLGQYKGADYEK